MTKPWPPPNIKPFERLNVTDGLLMNAGRWQLAHNYHRLRQNAHFQSLNQPGIVCDLGVYVIEPPSEIPAKYRDGRWVQIQPGIAIDLYGNFIVVNQPMDFRISSEAKDEAVMVYLVVSYVDPNKLRRQQDTDIFIETFRIDEKNTPPSEEEVELCRILLKPGEVQLSTANDVFCPGYNQLDLRFREQARARSQGLIQVAVLSTNDWEQDYHITQLSYLLQSVASLYPALEGSPEIGQIHLESKASIQQLLNYDLLFLSEQQSSSLQSSELAVLKKYLAAGGVVLVEASTKGSNLAQITAIKQDLQKAIAELANSEDLIQIRQELEQELAVITTELDKNINRIADTLQTFSQKFDTPLQPLAKLERNHRLRTQPFLFAALPTINYQPIQILVGGGIIVTIGNLSSAWGLDEELSYSRETIRTAQEMGINILHFAWRRRQLTQLQQVLIPVNPTDSAPRSELPTYQASQIPSP
jgi:hypothetical protein